MKKKAQKKAFKQIREANIACCDLVENLSSKYDFTDEERQQLDNLVQHLGNMNILFNQLETGLDSNGK